MLKKISNFIVNKRIVILAVMLILAAVSIFCSQFVKVNEDMTKYLPDNSNMKCGMDIMEDEFPEMETSGSIRVMFDGLTASQKETVLEKLEAVQYADSVDYDGESSDYNKDSYTLYVLNFSYDYGSDEELAIESALDSEFSDYTMVWRSNDSGFPAIPLRILVVVMVILMTILFTMCGSWIEPVLFLVTIGTAVVINSGTNLIMGSVANITNSISTILQLVLSIDYSIILMNRYRQEKELEPDKVQAMKNALANAFSSVASSSLTTVAGLLMLVFMSFKIGADLGIVLAKGVFISMVCVLTMLPGILLACDKLIVKTAKKVPQIPMNWAARFSHKMRYITAGLFVLLFVAAYILQQQTGIAYTLVKEDVIADVFPKDNMLVMVYENQDEDKVKDLAASLEKDENVKSVMGYSTIFKKAYTSGELADALKDMGEDIVLDSGVMDMLYYDYFREGKTGTMTAGEFLSFVSDTVMNDETFSGYIDDGMKENVDMLNKLADTDTLTTPMTAEELADFFGMDAADINDLFLLYYIENGGVSTGSMTLPVFADFVINEVSKDADYGSMFDEATLSKLSQLAIFTDAEKMTAPYTYERIASLLDMDAETAKLLFIYYYALCSDYDPGTMTLPEFVLFLQNDIANDPVFSSYLDKDAMEQIQQLAFYTDKSAMQRQRSAGELASMLGIGESMVKTVFILHNAQDVRDKTMTLAQFTGFLNSSLLSDPMFGASFDEAARLQLQTMDALIQLAASNKGLTPAGMAQTLGMDEAEMNQLYFLYFSVDVQFQKEAAAMKMTLQDFLTLLKANSTKEQQNHLEQMEQMTGIAVSGQELTSAQMAQILGMDEAKMSQLYFLYFSDNAQFQEEAAAMTMTLQDFVTLLKANSAEEQQAHVAQMEQIISQADAGKELTASELAGITGIGEEQISGIFAGQKPAADTMTLSAFLNIAVQLSEENIQLSQLNQMVQCAVSGTELDARTLARVFGIEKAQVQQVFMAALSSKRTISFADFTAFLVNDVLADEAYAGNFTEEQKVQVKTVNQMVQSAVSNTELDAGALASVFGIQETQVQQIFSLVLAPRKTISLADFTAFLVNDVLTNETYSANFTEEQKIQLLTMDQMVQPAASGTGLGSETLAGIFGMDKGLARVVFRLYYGGDISGKTMSLEETADFILADSVMGSYMDSTAISGLQMMQRMIKASVNGTEFTYGRLAELLGMDSSMLKMLYTVHTCETEIKNWSLSLYTLVNFLVNSRDTLGSVIESSQMDSLSTAQAVINGSVNGTSYTPAQLASLMGMEKNQAEQLYLLYISRHGDTSGWTLSVNGFIGFIVEDVLSDSEYSERIDADTSDMLIMARTIVNAVISGRAYTSAEMGNLLSGLSEGLEPSMTGLLYLYAESLENADSAWAMTLETLFNYMTGDVLNDSRFEAVIDPDMRKTLLDAEKTLNEGKSQFVTGQYSRLVITTAYPEEGEDTAAFLTNLEEYGSGHFGGKYYLVGNSAMNHEMRKTFDGEFRFITLLTAVGIFLIVALTFKSVSIPAILVLLVQCGVYITVTVTGILSGSMYYLALLIVECILMGAAIDYGILFTNYYRESRRMLDIREALKRAYAGSVHTIMTSGLILVTVTAAVGGMFEEATVCAIVKTLSIGSFCAIVLILFILPGVLAVCDKIVTRAFRS